MSAIVLERLRARFPEAVLATHAQHGDETAIIRAEHLLDVVRHIKEDPELSFDQLIDLTCLDTLGLSPAAHKAIAGAPASTTPVRGRFQMVYHFRSTKTGKRFRLKAPLDDAPDDAPDADGGGPVIDSLTPLYKAANWSERETWDMFGITFRGHSDLRRILLYEEFVGHPLRKDYPKEKRQPLFRRDPG